MRVEALRRRKKRIGAVTDLFKTVMIYVLTVSMLTFAGIYISDRQNSGRTPDIPWEKMIIFGAGRTALGEIDENQIIPVQITITAEGNSFTAIYNNDIISEIYKNFERNILGLFGVDTICGRLDKETGDKLWRACTEAANSVYIKYAGNYLYPVIYAFLDKTGNPEIFSGELATVHELFIIDEAPVYGVARDISGNVSVFIPEEITGDIIRSRLNTASLESAYNSIAGVIQSEFLKGRDISAKTGVNRNNIKNLGFPDSFLLFNNYNTFSPVLRFSNPILDENGRISTEQSFIRDFFNLLNFNIESSGSYPVRNGITFVDGKTTANFYNDGLIVYNGEIHLSKFLGYDAEHYAFYDKIKAASVFAGNLPGELTGNESSLYLINITADPDETLRLTFSYYYNGIKIKVNGDDEGVAVMINQDSITGVRINSFQVNALNPPVMIKDRNPILELSIIDGMISSDIESGAAKEDLPQKYKLAYDKIQDKFIVNAFELVYNIDYTGSINDEDLTNAAWEIR